MLAPQSARVWFTSLKDFPSSFTPPPKQVHTCPGRFSRTFPEAEPQTRSTALALQSLTLDDSGCTHFPRAHHRSCHLRTTENGGATDQRYEDERQADHGAGGSKADHSG